MYQQLVPAEMIARKVPANPSPPDRGRMENRAAKPAASTDEKPMKINNILIVDDDCAVRKALKKLLEAERYQVLLAQDAGEALNCFNSQPIDMVILDLKLRLECGWKVFEEMTETNPFVPTIIITAEWGQQERAATLGVEGLVEKPIDVPVFLEMIRNLLAETPEARLDRICGQNEYCRHVIRQVAPLLHQIEERRTAPLQLSTVLQAALQSRPAIGGTGDYGGSLNLVRKTFTPARKRNEAHATT